MIGLNSNKCKVQGEDGFRKVVLESASYTLHFFRPTLVLPKLTTHDKNSYSFKLLKRGQHLHLLRGEVPCMFELFS